MESTADQYLELKVFCYAPAVLFHSHICHAKVLQQAVHVHIYIHIYIAAVRRGSLTGTISSFRCGQEINCLNRT
jgi:hypothetical protein